MASEESFAEWIRRVRAGDERAAEELVRRYETAVRVAVRVRLTDGRLRQQLDSMDICQSVLGSFFVRAAAGQYDLDHPEQLVGLLVKMAQNKLFMQVRRHRTVGRDLSRARPLAEDVAPVPDREPGPERQAAGRDMLQRLLERLPEPVRDLARRRGEGQEWAEIARELGGLPQTYRMQLSRAIGRLAPQLGLDDADEEPS